MSALFLSRAEVLPGREEFLSLSVEWYHRWIETGDPLILQRILDYNQDDCVATRVRLCDLAPCDG